MKPPKSLYNLQGPEQIKAFKKEMFSYSVTREGIFPQRAEAALEQALINLKEPGSNQKSRQEKFLRDRTTLQGFEKDFLGDKSIKIAEYYKALGVDTKNAIAYYYNKGNKKFVLCDYKGALADYNKLLELNPDFLYGHQNRGAAKHNLDDYKGAIADYNKEIDINPDNAEVFYLRGVTKNNLGDYRGAIADYNKAIEINPGKLGAFYLRGMAKSDIGDYSEAITDFTKTLRMDPSRTDIYYDIGRAKYKLGDYSGAISDFNQTLKMDSTRTCVYYHRGRAKFWIGDYGGTISDCSKAIEFDPNNAKNHVLRGDAKFKKGKKKEACRDWEKAGKLGYTKAYDLIENYRKNRLFGGTKREMTFTILKLTGAFLLILAAFNPDTFYKLVLERYEDQANVLINNYWPLLLLLSYIFIIINGMWPNRKKV